MKYTILFFFLLVSFLIYCQKSDTLFKPQTNPNFKRETNILIKIGTTINVPNKTFYKELNDGLAAEPYKSDNITFFINPYISLGVEAKIKKHFGLHFNLGFYQTLQKYTTVVNYQTLVPGYSKKYNEFTNITKYEYVNNNIFLELLPTYHYKRTRILAGFNATVCSPKKFIKTSIENLSTNETETFSSIDKQLENYHIYSMLGVMQGFPVKKHEFTISATYFGFLKKYDSGLNLTLGFIF